MALALAASLGLGCSGGVVVEDSTGSGGSGNGGQGGEGGALVGGGGQSQQGGSGGSTSQGGGGSGPLPEPVCASDELALVAATAASGNAVLSPFALGKWQPKTNLPLPATTVLAHRDAYQQVQAFWIDTEGISHVMRSGDGLTFETYDVQSWAPHAPLFAINEFTVAGRVDNELRIAYFDADAFDYKPYGEGNAFAASSGVFDPSYGPTFAGVSPGDHTLCELSFFETSWLSPMCHSDLVVDIGGEIAKSGPRLVALPDGDVVAIYFKPESSNVLAAVSLRSGGGENLDTTQAGDALYFAAAATASNEVVVAMIDGGKLLSLRWSKALGWSTPVLIEDGVQYVEPAVAPGICGDDALIAYVAGGIDGKIQIARVRGDGVATTTAMTLVEEAPAQLSLVTRGTMISP